MKILCTGASGFIGFNFLIRAFSGKPEVEVLGLDKKNLPDPNFIGKKFIKCNICDLEAMERIFESFQPDVVIHMAARTDLDGGDIGEYFENIQGVRNICNLVKKFGVKKTIFFSSRLVNEIGYTPLNDTDYTPSTIYGQSKAEGEMIVRAKLKERDYIILRPTSIWGEWFGVPYRNFFDAVQKRVFFKPGSAKVKKTFGYVGNVVRQVELLCYQFDNFSGRTMYLADRNDIEVGEFSDLIANKFGVRRPVVLPRPIYFFLASAGTFLESLSRFSMPITKFRYKNMICEMRYDMSWIDRLENYNEINLEDAVDKTVEWMKKRN